MLTKRMINKKIINQIIPNKINVIKQSNKDFKICMASIAKKQHPEKYNNK